MTPEIVTKLNDYRDRIVQAYDMRNAGQEPPPDLMPSEDEIREGLRILREERSGAASKNAASKPKSKANKMAAPGFDLMSLFDKVPDKPDANTDALPSDAIAGTPKDANPKTSF